MRAWLLLGAAAAAVCYYLFFYTPPIPVAHDFSEAKRVMESRIVHDHRVTLYCGAEFDADKNVRPEPGFWADAYKARAGRVEWEHAVPAENFGRSLPEWREGSKACVGEKGPFKGRKCAQLASAEFREMESDMYNLFPAIGAVNAARGHRRYAELPGAEPAFGSCAAKLAPGRFEPPDRAKGQVARAALYMDWQYPSFSLSPHDRRLFEAWSRKYPVDEWECKRTKRIEESQRKKKGGDRGENPFVKLPCLQAGLWQGA